MNSELTSGFQINENSLFNSLPNLSNSPHEAAIEYNRQSIVDIQRRLLQQAIDVLYQRRLVEGLAVDYERFVEETNKRLQLDAIKGVVGTILESAGLFAGKPDLGGIFKSGADTIAGLSSTPYRTSSAVGVASSTTWRKDDLSYKLKMIRGIEDKDYTTDNLGDLVKQREEFWSNPRNQGNQMWDKSFLGFPVINDDFRKKLEEANKTSRNFTDTLSTMANSGGANLEQFTRYTSDLGEAYDTSFSSMIERTGEFSSDQTELASATTEQTGLMNTAYTGLLHGISGNLGLMTNSMGVVQSEAGAMGQGMGDALDLVSQRTTGVGDALSFMGQRTTGVGDIFGNTFGIMGNAADGMFTGLEAQTHRVLTGLMIGEINSLEDAWDVMATGIEGIWDNALNNMLGSFVDWGASLVTNFAKAGLNDLFSMLTGGSGGSLDKLLGDGLLNLFGGRGSGGGGGLGALGSGGGLVAGVKGAAEWLGLESLLGGANTTASLMASGPAATAAAEAALAAEVAAALEGLEIGASLDLGAIATEIGAGAGTEGVAQTGALAAGLAGPGLAFGLALAPGMVGMMFHDQISGLFGWDGGLTPEEAKSNFFGDDNQIGGGPGGSLAVLEHWSQKLDELTENMGTVNEQLGLFGESTQEAWEDFERLGTVAGYTAEEMDAVYNSLDANTQILLTSGEAANLLEDEVRQLASEINASANSMTLAGGGAKAFNERIGDLAGRLGLSGQAALEFQGAIYELSEGFNLGGEEAMGFEDTLESFIQGTLASLTQGAEGSRQAIQALIESMKGVAGASESMKVEDMGDGVTRFTAIDYASGGKVDSLGSGIGGNEWMNDLGIGSFHRGGLVMGWPRAHAGALISSLAHDEVPIVARRGEYVVRAESVNAATLPALKALNRGAATPAGDMAVNFTININGNVMGNDDQIEDMVRLIETRLRQLRSSRWGG